LLALAPYARTPGARRALAADPGQSPPAVAVTARAAAPVPAPVDVLGFTPGDDRKLASWAQMLDYFRKLAAASDRVKLEELGQTTLGRPFVVAIISAPENMARLEVYKDIQRRLADPRTLGARPEVKAEGLISNGKTVVLITCGIHSTEVGGNLVSMLIAHRLASSDEPEIRSILQNCIVLLVPSLNPDGVDIVKNWYDKTLGTPYEGTSPPELYHKYAGHDNNRDWYAFTQVETQLTVDKIHNVWHPQIVHDIHQQGENGSRLFLPPYMKPVEPNVPQQIVAGYTELGNYMAASLRTAGFKGITTDSTYDAWTPARAYSHYHGGVRILSETASARLASPLTVKFSELRSREGYDPQKETANFGPLWQGGEWRLRDITNYMDAAAFALLRHAAEHRQEWLQRFYEIGKQAVRPRRPGELWGFQINSASSWTSYHLEEILRRAGVEVIYTRARPVVRRAKSPALLAPQEALVRMDQPYASFAKALLEVQHYPDLRDESGHPIAPYDVTAHTLPLLMGVEVKPLFAPVKYRPVAVKRSEFMWGKGLAMPRVGIYKSYVPALDEGWTRWAFKHDANFLYDTVLMEEDEADKAHVNVWTLEDAELRAGHLRAKYDTIVIPDQSPRAILNGHRAGTMPPEYTGGVGEAGVRALREFVEQGGTLVALNKASDFAIEQLKLPVRDITAGLPQTEYYAPGSILRIELDRTHPIAADMQRALKAGYDEEAMEWRYSKVPKESVAWVENSPVFEVDTRDIGARVRIVAHYPVDRDPLLSGWLLGGRKLWGKAALVEVTLGRGRVILFGFRPQYRGQSFATYPLFFNALAAKAD
jgi:hypothetical protein